MNVNRREALAALLALPATTRITRAAVQPDDVLVLECPGKISEAAGARIRTYIENVWPGHKCVILCDGLTLKIVPGK
jgi:hypothetical protein